MIYLLKHIGSIPAWAGETRLVECNGDVGKVYPRVGGGNVGYFKPRLFQHGLSPRGRGKRSRRRQTAASLGSIPAWAGETQLRRRLCMGREVYPRVGGGNEQYAHHRICYRGLSPRGRGKHFAKCHALHCFGSIPAWAGETSTDALFVQTEWVYPRVGGGNVFQRSAVRAGGGLSPRGRGKRGRPTGGAAFGRSIPAWAGETCVLDVGLALDVVYPRVGGGNRWLPFQPGKHAGLSPRGRGKPYETQR